MFPTLRRHLQGLSHSIGLGVAGFGHLADMARADILLDILLNGGPPEPSGEVPDGFLPAPVTYSRRIMSLLQDLSTSRTFGQHQLVLLVVQTILLQGQLGSETGLLKIRVLLVAIFDLLKEGV